MRQKQDNYSAKLFHFEIETNGIQRQKQDICQYLELSTQKSRCVSSYLHRHLETYKRNREIQLLIWITYFLTLELESRETCVKSEIITKVSKITTIFGVWTLLNE